MKAPTYDCLMIGKNIRAYRLYNRLKQSELAQLIGVSAGMISNLETGRCGLSVELLFRLAHALNCRMSDLVEGV